MAFETSKPIVGLYIVKKVVYLNKTVQPSKGASIFLKVWTVVQDKKINLKLTDHTKSLTICWLRLKQVLKSKIVRFEAWIPNEKTTKKLSTTFHKLEKFMVVLLIFI